MKTPKDQGRKHRRAGSAQLQNGLQPLLRMALKPMARAHYKDV
nr:B213 [uncultured bacterium]